MYAFGVTWSIGVTLRSTRKEGAVWSQSLRSASLSRWLRASTSPVDTQVAMLKTVPSKADINSTNINVLPILGEHLSQRDVGIANERRRPCSIFKRWLN